MSSPALKHSNHEHRNPRLARLGLGEKAGFAIGDFGFNLYWTCIASFLAVFYTDVFGLPAAIAGTLLLITKLIDAMTDPLMGAIADRTQTRWGKFRPYLLFAGVPMAAASVLTFTTPDLNGTGKLIYAYITYSAMMLGYTLLSTPYASLSGVMTAHPQERNTLISWRFIAAFAGMTFVNKYTLPLVEWLGRGNEQLGWQLTMMVYGALACVIFAVTFFTTRERIEPPAVQNTRPLDDIKDLLHNRPWLILVGLQMVIMLTITLRGGSSYYYLMYYVERPELISNYLAVQALALAGGAAITPLLTRYFDKALLIVILMCVVGTLSLAFYFVPKDAVWLMFTLNILISLALGPKSPLAWSMFADCADYTEWRSGRRATAMTFSAATFSMKLGGAMGSALMLWVLAAIGYVAREAQSGASQAGIALLQTVIPGAFALLAAAVASFYPLNNARLERIQEELGKGTATGKRDTRWPLDKDTDTIAPEERPPVGRPPAGTAPS
ncbi:glycoside-pentoside-hexuronide (GPH):cation symporter [Microbulbifer sp. YPW1]|uniref:glycoside-pentoside-hexuronide (GPH):cation symporter n=1 Tax=Microbulbifer sp. YPW1 TaxID=2745199 RepID=UPI001597D399|nr:glycoside-pentoside-hexuronide (GPH):cation symporter [Microbulbifer sp. YPW1]QKX16259.1 MFS transporter [Microbulbifer sp. YPW1]